MPGGDRTGPSGFGSRTGRGAGYCSGYDVPGYMNPVPGRGFGGFGRSGRGGGRGWRNWYYATGMPGWHRAGYGYPAYGVPYSYPPEPTAEEEKEILADQAEALKRELDDIQNRINVLEKAQGQEEKK